MRAVFEIARLYVTESIRRQLHLITLFLGVLLLVMPNLFNTFGMTGFDRVTKDVALTLLGLYAAGMALFLGSTAVPADVERRTLYPLLARPISRMQYLLGKFAGFFVIMAASLILLGLCLLSSLALLGAHGDPRVMIAVGLYILEASVLGAFCLFCSTFASPALAGVLGAFVYIIGGLSQTFIEFFLTEGGQQVQGLVARGVRLVIPHFDVMQLKDPIVHGAPIPESYLASVALYAVGWTILFLLLADWSFEGKDL